MPLLTMEIIGITRALEKVRVVRERAADLRPFWSLVFAPLYFAGIQDLFATGGRTRGAGGRFAGGAWAPLSPKYGAWKSQHYPGAPILVREGTLRDSVNWSGSGLGRFGIFEPTPRTVTVGTRAPGAAAHMTGTAHMPARRFMEPPDPTVFGELLKRWLLRHA